MCHTRPVISRERSWTARVIAEERDRIVREWLAVVRHRVPGLRVLSRPLLLDHLPQSVAALADWLDSDLDEPEFALISEEHGAQRLSHGVLLQEIASEYRVLREVILTIVAERERDAATRDQATRVHELARLNAGLDFAVTTAIEKYADIREDAVKALQERLQLAIHAAGVGTWDYDPITHTFAWDTQCRRLFGLPPGENNISYDEFLALIHPDDRAQVAAGIQQALDPTIAGTYRGEYRLTSSLDGVNDHWLLSEGQTLFDLRRQPARFIGTVVDITAPKRLLDFEQNARQRADDDHATLHTLFMQAPAAIAVLRGPDHRFELANTLYLRLVSRRDIVGLPLREALPEIVEQGFLQLLDKVYTTGKSHYGHEVPVQLRHAMDSDRLETIFLNFAYEPIRDDAGHVTGIFVIAFDVSESVHGRRLIEDARHLAESNAALEANARKEAEAAASRSQFLVNAVERLSHRLDVDAILQEITRLVVPDLADMATTRLVAASGEMRLVSTALPEPIGDELQERFPVVTLSPDFAPTLRGPLAAAEVQLVDDVARWLDGNGPSAEHAAYVKSLGVKQLALVPLVAHERTVGLLSVGLTSTTRTFDPQRVQLLKTLGRHAALALENARMYEEAQQLRRRAEEASVTKDQFIATVSHELRTPLNAILGWSQIIKANPDAQAMLTKGIETIERNARAQAQLIEDLLDISRIVVGKLKIEPTSVYIPRVIEAALDSARPAAEAKKITLETDVDADVGHIIADPDRFQQVVWNLISNSVKFTPTGGKVRIAARRLASQFELSVSDDGKGITPDFLPYVFEKFHQVEQGNRKVGGLGLGLAIVRNIVELHGGTVRAESEGLGKGATFTVRIPIRAAARPITRPPMDSETAEEATFTLPPHVLEGLRILVVDDEQDARELLGAILGDAGATVRLATCVDEAMVLLQTEVPDALVSDVGMPTKDGYALARELRGLPRDQGGRIPAIALTAHARSEDRTRALTAGFSTHIPKPVDPTELIVVLANALGREVQDPSGGAS
ncbi:ATP-binding protein [Chondromyces crocatus]|uniref:histidine kinase n=1 Tax=Chondromyces crocatus TaxID=52 RepID=A0A0K1EPI2_CHOCO|nr:ATP-binding protein [Chondromyces crocatus]AKT42761.1 uncharacterized protein CMC5_069880 [Chondromyces crocatus]